MQRKELIKLYYLTKRILMMLKIKDKYFILIKVHEMKFPLKKCGEICFVGNLDN